MALCSLKTCFLLLISIVGPLCFWMFRAHNNLSVTLGTWWTMATDRANKITDSAEITRLPRQVKLELKSGSLQELQDKHIIDDARLNDSSELHGRQEHLIINDARLSDSSKYSQHDCRGTPRILETRRFSDANKKSNGRKFFHSNRTCRFQNVCYDLKADRKSLLYFSSASDTGASSDVPTSLDLVPLSTKFVPAVNLTVTIIPGRIPEQAARFPSPVAVLFQPYGAENFGHHIADTMYSVHVMQQIFDISEPFNSQLLVFSLCSGFGSNHAYRSTCLKLMAKLYPAITRHSLLEFRSSDLLEASRDSQTKQAHFMCFKTLLVGAGANSFRADPLPTALSYYNYRNFVIRNLLGSRCADAACGSVASLNRILILNKTEFRSGPGSGPGIRNGQAILQHLTPLFPNLFIELLDLAFLSFKDQVAKIIQSAVMVSHGGGGMFSAVFLPQRAVLAMIVHFQIEYDFMSSLHWFSTRKLQTRTYKASNSRNAVPKITVSPQFVENIVREATTK